MALLHPQVTVGTMVVLILPLASVRHTALCTRGCRYGAKGVFVQASDDCHFNGRGFTGKLALRDRVVPPEHLLPVYHEGVKHVVKTIRASHEATETEVKTVLSQ